MSYFTQQSETINKCIIVVNGDMINKAADTYYKIVYANEGTIYMCNLQDAICHELVACFIK